MYLFPEFDSPALSLFDTVPAVSLPGEIAAETSPLYVQRSLKPESDAAIDKALQSDAVARRILAKQQFPAAGDQVGVRLNINVMKSTGVAVHSIHRATSKDGHTKGRGFYRGGVISYLPAVTLKDAFFNIHQGGREGIASGTTAKHPMASVDGTFQIEEGDFCFDGVEISFNPKITHLFVDADGYAVQYAEEVTILGNRAYARGRMRYFTKATVPARAGDAPSIAKIRA
jgi:hypothetical protein